MAADIDPKSVQPAYSLPAVTVDVVVFMVRGRVLQVLLIKRRSPPFQGYWAIPGGFVEIDESLDEAAHRELAEETGITGAYLEQLYTFGDPGRDPRMRVISVAYLGMIPSDRTSVVAGDDASEAGWFSVQSLPPLAFDHSRIMECAIQHLRRKIRYTNSGLRLLPELFTLSELQAVYETVLGEEFDKRNFRRRIFQSNIVEEAGGFRTGEGRPAKLYRCRAGIQNEVRVSRLFP
jgi:8-oxo-dGTP diphosphatase